MSDRNHLPEIDLLEHATKRLRGLAIPPGPPSRLAASTIEALQAASQIPGATGLAGRRALLFRVLRYGGAVAAALVALTAGALLLLDRHAATAWAQVVENVGKARTVSFMLKQKFGANPEIESRMFLRDTVLRYEIVDALTMIVDTDTRRGIELDAARKIARNADLDGQIPAEGLKAPIDRLRNLGKGDADKVAHLGEEERDGVRCLVFQITGPPAFLVSGNFKLWVDAKTSLPVRIEAGDEQTTLTYEQFRWDEPLKDELFRLDLPDGYQLEELRPAVIHPGRIYYHQGSTAMNSIGPDGKQPETQFVPRATAPAVYVSERSELSPDGRFLAIGYTHIDGAAYPPNSVLLWDRTRPEHPAAEVYLRPKGEMQSWQFSPDGNRLYVVYWEQIPGQEGPPGRYGADVVELDTKAVRAVKLPTYQDADGTDKEMYFATATADGMQYVVVGDGLHLATTEGVLVRRLMPAGSRLDQRTVQLSPDGKRVLFSRIEEDRSQRVCTVALSDGELRDLTPESTYVDVHACWSPDGRRIAYTCRSFVPNAPPFHQGTETFLKVMAADGAGEVTLVKAKVHPQAAGFELTGWR